MRVGKQGSAVQGQLGTSADAEKKSQGVTPASRRRVCLPGSENRPSQVRALPDPQQKSQQGGREWNRRAFRRAGGKPLLQSPAGTEKSERLHSATPALPQGQESDASSLLQGFQDPVAAHTLSVDEQRQGRNESASRADRLEPASRYQQEPVHESALTLGRDRNEKEQEDKLLKKHFYTKPGVAELAEEVARMAAPLKRVAELREAYHAVAQPAGSEAGKQLRAALKDLKAQTGLRHGECIQKVKQLDALRMQHMQPVLELTQERIASKRHVLERTSREINECVELRGQKINTLDQWDLTLARVERDLAQCREQRAQVLHQILVSEDEQERNLLEDQSQNLAVQEQSLSADLEQLKDKNERDRLTEEVVVLTRTIEAKEHLLEVMQSQLEQLTDRPRILKRLISGFKTDEQVQQAASLVADQQELFALQERTQELEFGVVNHRNALYLSLFQLRWIKAWGHYKGLRAAKRDQQAMTELMAQKASAVQKLSRQLNVDPSSMMVRTGSDGRVSWSEKVDGILKFGFTEVGAVYRLSSDGRVKMELSALDATGKRLHGKQLLDALEERHSELKERGWALEDIDRLVQQQSLEAQQKQEQERQEAVARAMAGPTFDTPAGDPVQGAEGESHQDEDCFDAHEDQENSGELGASDVVMQSARESLWQEERAEGAESGRKT